MSPTNKNEKQIDALANVKKHPDYESYKKAARRRLNLAVEVFKRRKELDLTQAKLAEEVKTTQRIISNIENTDFNVGFDLLGRLCDRLHFDDEQIATVMGCRRHLQLFVGSETAKQNNVPIPGGYSDFDTVSPIELSSLQNYPL